MAVRSLNAVPQPLLPLHSSPIHSVHIHTPEYGLQAIQRFLYVAIDTYCKNYPSQTSPPAQSGVHGAGYMCWALFTPDECDGMHSCFAAGARQQSHCLCFTLVPVSTIGRYCSCRIDSTKKERMHDMHGKKQDQAPSFKPISIVVVMMMMIHGASPRKTIPASVCVCVCVCV